MEGVPQLVHKLCYIHTMESYSAIKTDITMIHATTWMNLKCILLTKTKLKGYLLFDSIYMMFWKRQKNYRDRTKEWVSG